MGRLCYPTKHPGRVLLPRASGAKKLSWCKEGMAWFLPLWYKFYYVQARSRYKFNRSPETITVQDFGYEHRRSVAIQFVPEPEDCHVAGF